MTQRTVFFVSDQTGVTAETMGHSLLTQFGGLAFRQVTLPFISTVDKAQEAVRKINSTASTEGIRPIVFSTLVQEEMREIVKHANGLFLDFFDAFLGPLERELQVKSSRTQGRAHGMTDLSAYSLRIDATNFALANDDARCCTDFAADSTDGHANMRINSRTCSRRKSRNLINGDTGSIVSVQLLLRCSCVNKYANKPELLTVESDERCKRYQARDQE